VERIWYELLGGQDYIDVPTPVRIKRQKFSQDMVYRERYIELAKRKLKFGYFDGKQMVLILLDAEDDPPCILGPKLLADAQKILSGSDLECASVIANVEYETFFVAAAESLPDYLESDDVRDPEVKRCGKKWVKDRFRLARPYNEPQDMPGMTAKMDIKKCRERCPSFDKLCRELGRFI
jgi:hypothetical protein